ncbi:CesT family type III secretion system chaperone [Variovorax sp. DT-64]|uniref:CesT family type III secretion system chaperone n=1 Tax=Variovorax sp. DT-64 TaxID=3396160 RepID=UPI003F19C99D
MTDYRLAFIALAREVCDVLGKAHLHLEMDAEQQCSFQMEMGDIPFLIVHGDTHDPGRFSIYARLGQPAADDARAYRRLLEINPLLLASGNATLGMDSQSGDIVLAFQDEIAAFNADILLDRLDDAVDLAIRWREDGFEAAQASPDWAAAIAMV